MNDRNKDLDTTKVFDMDDGWDSDAVTDFHKFVDKEVDALAEMSGERRAALVALSGLHIGEMFQLGSGRTVIGRGKECDLRIADNSISRNHAEIVALPDGSHQLKDLGSTNGVFIGRHRVENQVLKEGDRVVFGHRFVYKLVYQDNLEQSYQHVLHSSAVRDPLTHAYNRKYLSEKLRTDHSYCRRHETSLTMVMLDIDHFKKVNDEYGHQTGDMVLKTVTKAMEDLIRAEDTLGRFGGEEFAVIAPGTDLEGGESLAERIREKIAGLVLVAVDDESSEFSITVSLGVATAVPPIKGHPDEVLALADTNLYRAKNDGRNRTRASAVIEK